MTFQPSRPRKFPAPKYPPGRIRSKEVTERPFELTSFELPFFDIIAREHSKGAGTVIWLYTQVVSQAKRHPAYGEPLPTGRVFKGPWKMKGWFAWTDSTPLVRPEGMTREYDSQCWIARSEMEAVHCPPPKNGDVILVWNTPFFKAQDDTSQEQTIPNASYYFDVQDADNDGHLFDTPDFVGFTFNLKRDSAYTPERRLNVVSER